MENVYWNILSDLIIRFWWLVIIPALLKLYGAGVRLWRQHAPMITQAVRSGASAFRVSVKAFIVAHLDAMSSASPPEQVWLTACLLVRVLPFMWTQIATELQPTTGTKVRTPPRVTGHGAVTLPPLSIAGSATVHAVPATATAAALAGSVHGSSSARADLRAGPAEIKFTVMPPTIFTTPPDEDTEPPGDESPR